MIKWWVTRKMGTYSTFLIFTNSRKHAAYHYALMGSFLRYYIQPLPVSNASLMLLHVKMRNLDKYYIAILSNN